MTTKQELLKKRDALKKKIWDIEQVLKNKSFVSSVDFASMYPNIIRLLNASIESLVGFLDDNPIAYRELGLSSNVEDSELLSANLVKTKFNKTKYAEFVGKKEKRLALRVDLYNGKYSDADIYQITETPFERYFLGCMGVFDPDQITIKFQGKDYTVSQLRDYFKQMDYSVSGSGAVFKRTVGKDGEFGLIPAYLEFLFKERKSVKKSMAVNYKRMILLKKFKNAAIADGIWNNN